MAPPMSAPRVLFTVTYLLQNETLIIAGGTNDYVYGLSSYDIYYPSNGCYDTLNMNFSRMAHAAVYDNSSDRVLLIGGLSSMVGNDTFLASQIISTFNVDPYSPLNESRLAPVVATLNDSNIVVVGGKNGTYVHYPLELFNYSSSLFQPLPITYDRLLTIEGHSVTFLESTGSAFIFGGAQSNLYSGAGFLFDGSNLAAAATLNLTALLTEDEIPARAHHQATYISQIDAVLITGGNNLTQVFNTSYLYFVGNNTYVPTGTMQTPRSFHTAVGLVNGSVLVIGGALTVNSGMPMNPTASVEIFDFRTGTFSSSSSLNVPRYYHQSALLPSDEIFVFGGVGPNNTILSSVEYTVIS